MRRSGFLLALALGLATLASASRPARAWSKQPQWVKANSPHFTVYCDAGVKEARQIAGQMERMRLVFQQLFPQFQLGTAEPLDVLVVRNWKEFLATDPDSFHKGDMKPAGMFLRGQFRSFILLRLDAMDGTDAYSTIYHEYTHYIVDRMPFEFPVWLNEGLAEFYQTAVITKSGATLADADPSNFDVLRSQRMIPLAQLFAIGPNSPYYHDQDKVSIFYAESWLAVHYIMMHDFFQHTHQLDGYIARIRDGENPVTAARASFGNLAALQKNLERFAQQLGYRDLHMKLRVLVQDKGYPAAPVTTPNAEAIEAQLLAQGQQYVESVAMANRALQIDPGNGRAEAVRGLVAYRQKDYATAQSWLQRAANADPHDALAQILLGEVMLRPGNAPGLAAQAALAGHLQDAVRQRPDYAPAWNMLALVEMRQPGKVAAAAAAERRAIALAPSQYVFRFNAAIIQLNAGHFTQAIPLLQLALQRADSPERVLQCRQTLMNAEAEQSIEQANARDQNQNQDQDTAPSRPRLMVRTKPEPPLPPPPPEQVIRGKVASEICPPHGGLYPIALEVRSHGGLIHLSSGPSFSWRARVMPGKKFDLCHDATGRQVIIHERGGFMSSLQVLGTKS
ncbi:MAG: hypothetical protein ACRD1Y_02985 [Terriglobales bacterium]